MAAASLEASSAIVAVAWGDLGSCEVLAAVTAQGSLHVCAAVEASLWEETVEEMLQNADPTEGRPTTLPVRSVLLSHVQIRLYQRCSALSPVLMQVALTRPEPATCR